MSLMDNNRCCIDSTKYLPKKTQECIIILYIKTSRMDFLTILFSKVYWIHFFLICLRYAQLAMTIRPKKGKTMKTRKKQKRDVQKENNTRACSKVETASGRRNVSASAGKALEIHPPKVLSISADTPLPMTTCLRYSFPFMKEKLSSSPEP